MKSESTLKLALRFTRIRCFHNEGLAGEYAHQVVDDAAQYVNGRVHTNGLENLWSLLKCGISGTYVSVEPFHLFRYLDEQTFRFNNRATKDNPLNDSDRFVSPLAQITAKRLTYSRLTGKEAQPPTAVNRSARIERNERLVSPSVRLAFSLSERFS